MLAACFESASLLFLLLRGWSPLELLLFKAVFTMFFICSIISLAELFAPAPPLGSPTDWLTEEFAAFSGSTLFRKSISWSQVFSRFYCWFIKLLPRPDEARSMNWTPSLSNQLCEGWEFWSLSSFYMFTPPAMLCCAVPRPPECLGWSMPCGWGLKTLELRSMEIEELDRSALICCAPFALVFMPSYWSTDRGYCCSRWPCLPKFAVLPTPGKLLSLLASLTPLAAPLPWLWPPWPPSLAPVTTNEFDW